MYESGALNAKNKNLSRDFSVFLIEIVIGRIDSESRARYDPYLELILGIDLF